MRYNIAKANRLGNRKNNQDRIAYIEREGTVLLLLADGMGGYAGGEIAAALFVNKISQYFSDASLPIANPQKFLLAAFTYAHRAIIDRSKNSNPPIEPRTTGIACLIQNNKVIWAHLGDSRCYLFRLDKVHAKTRDHSVVEDLIKNGELSEKDREKHPRKNQVTRCLGGTDKMSTLSIGSMIDLEEDDTLLLCSDGMWSPMTDQQIIDYLDPRKTLDTILTTICEDAEKATYPKADNISVVAMQYKNNKPPIKNESTTGEVKHNDEYGLAKNTTQANLMVDEIAEALKKL